MFTVPHTVNIFTFLQDDFIFAKGTLCFFERLDDLQFNALFKSKNDQDFISKLYQNVKKSCNYRWIILRNTWDYLDIERSMPRIWKKLENTVKVWFLSNPYRDSHRVRWPSIARPRVSDDNIISWYLDISEDLRSLETHLVKVEFLFRKKTWFSSRDVELL